jgi:hypothetical protein
MLRRATKDYNTQAAFRPTSLAYRSHPAHISQPTSLEGEQSTSMSNNNPRVLLLVLVTLTVLFSTLLVLIHAFARWRAKSWRNWAWSDKLVCGLPVSMQATDADM